MQETSSTTLLWSSAASAAGLGHGRLGRLGRRRVTSGDSRHCTAPFGTSESARPKEPRVQSARSHEHGTATFAQVTQVTQVTQVAGECVHDSTRITCIKSITKHEERHQTALHSTTCITPGPCGRMLRPIKASWTKGK